MTVRRKLLLVPLVGALAASVALAANAGAETTPAPTPARVLADPPTVNRPDAAAGWLARQLIDGERFETVVDGVARPDQDLTIDAIFGLAGAKVAGDYARRAMSWLGRAEIHQPYIGDGATTSLVGPTAKLALAEHVVYGMHFTFPGGGTLVDRLRALETPGGRFVDRSATGDTSDVISQSYALLALNRTSLGPSRWSVDFLAKARCADGGFPRKFGQPTCVSDLEATAMAAQVLRAADRRDDYTPAANWLRARQGAGGSFADAAGVPNAVTTGRAAQGLRGAGRPIQWLLARSFLFDLQVGCAGPVDQRGAIAHTSAGFDPATSVRATVLALPGLTGSILNNLTEDGSTEAAPVLDC